MILVSGMRQREGNLKRADHLPAVLVMLIYGLF